MARKKNNNHLKCHKCGKDIYVIEKTNDPALLSLGSNEILKPTEEYGCGIREVVGKKEVCGKIIKQYGYYNVCRDCMTIEDIQNDSLIPEAKERKVKYVKERGK